MRRVIALLALSACGYPDYAFVADDATIEPGADSSTDTAVSVDTSLDSPPSDGPSADTGSDAGVDATTPDTTASDTSSADSGKADTAALDSTVVAETSTGCDGSTALFCEDWDKGTTTLAKFDFTDVATTGSLALEGSAFSPPNTLVAAIAPGDASVVTADLGKNIVAPSPDSVMRVDAWLKLEKLALPTTTGGAFLFKLERGSSGTVGDGVTFSIDDKGFYVDRIALTYELYRVAYKPPADTWFHVRMDVLLKTSTGAFTLWIDDMVTPRLAKTGISTVTAETTARRLILGLYAQAATGTFRARYDDVSVSVAP